MSISSHFSRRVVTLSGVTLTALALAACGAKTPADTKTPTDIVKSVPVDVTPPVQAVSIPNDMTPRAAFSAGAAAYKAKDLGKAEAYFKLAASGDLYAADNYLGLIYNAKGDMNNPSMAAKHFERALTDAPRLTPLTMLARAYASGNGVSQDAVTALQYYARIVAVSKNNAAAVTEAREALASASADDMATANSREVSAITAAGGTAKGTLMENVAIALGELSLNAAPK